MIKLSKKEAYDINKRIEALIDERGADSKSYNAESKAFIAQYTGYGGLDTEGASGKGILYEYYTPEKIIRSMWALALKHGFKGGLVSEPSCGSGEFLRFAPHQKQLEKSIAFVCYEINPYSAKIAQILNAHNAVVRNAPYETHFIQKNESVRDKVKAEYDLVIGNPPYGDIKGMGGGKFFAMGEDTYSKAQNYDEYFILRGLDTLKKDGLLVFIVGAEVAAGGKPFLMRGETPCKEKIMQKADIVEAFRLPNGVFDRTDVLSDIIILRKK
jgi:type I restriction-modification system DNA methylase subunit